MKPFSRENIDRMTRPLPRNDLKFPTEAKFAFGLGALGTGFAILLSIVTPILVVLGIAWGCLELANHYGLL